MASWSMGIVNMSRIPFEFIIAILIVVIAVFAVSVLIAGLINPEIFRFVSGR